MLKLKLGPPDAKNWFIDKDPERLRAGKEGDNRGWDCWMVSLTLWTWVWASSRSWWWTGKPDVLQSMGSQRVGHDWAAELTELKFANILLRVFFIDVHSRNWLFLVVLLSGFGIRVMKASLNEFGNISPPSILRKILRRMGPN